MNIIKTLNIIKQKEIRTNDQRFKISRNMRLRKSDLKFDYITYIESGKYRKIKSTTGFKVNTII